MARLGGSDVAFLARPGTSERALRLLAGRAERNGTNPSAELLAAGFSPQLYWSRLADDLGLDFQGDLAGAEIVSDASLLTTEAVRHATSVMARRGGETMLVLAPRGEELALLRRRLAETPALAARIRIAAPETIRAFLVAHRHRALTHYAVNRLAHVLPTLSADGLRRKRGASGPVALLAAALALLLLAPLAAAQALALLSTLFFLNCSVWKVAAALKRPRPLRVEPLSDRRLPTYTVMVPLYREAAVAADLVANMRALDYPALCIKRTTAAAGGLPA